MKPPRDEVGKVGWGGDVGDVEVAMPKDQVPNSTKERACDVNMLTRLKV